MHVYISTQTLDFLFRKNIACSPGKWRGLLPPSTSPPETGFHRGSQASFWEISTEANLSSHWRSKICAQMRFDPSSSPPETGFHRGSGGVFCPPQLRRATHWFLRIKTRNWSKQSHPQRHSKAYVYILGNEWKNTGQTQIPSGNRFPSGKLRNQPLPKHQMCPNEDWDPKLTAGNRFPSGKWEKQYPMATSSELILRIKNRNASPHQFACRSSAAARRPRLRRRPGLELAESLTRCTWFCPAGSAERVPTPFICWPWAGAGRGAAIQCVQQHAVRGFFVESRPMAGYWHCPQARSALVLNKGTKSILK